MLFEFMIDVLACIGAMGVSIFGALKVLSWLSDLVNEGRPRPIPVSIPGERVIFSALPITITARTWQYPTPPPERSNKFCSTTSLQAEPISSPQGSSQPLDPEIPVFGQQPPSSSTGLGTLENRKSYSYPIVANTPVRNPWNNNRYYAPSTQNSNNNQLSSESLLYRLPLMWSTRHSNGPQKNAGPIQSQNRSVITNQPSNQYTCGPIQGLFSNGDGNMKPETVRYSTFDNQWGLFQTAAVSQPYRSQMTFAKPLSDEKVFKPQQTRQGFQIQEPRKFSFAPKSTPAVVTYRRRSNFSDVDDY